MHPAKVRRTEILPSSPIKSTATSKKYDSAYQDTRLDTSIPVLTNHDIERVFPKYVPCREQLSEHKTHQTITLQQEACDHQVLLWNQSTVRIGVRLAQRTDGGDLERIPPKVEKITDKKLVEVVDGAGAVSSNDLESKVRLGGGWSVHASVP